MRRRRVHFAAPFVLIVGCGGAAHPRPDPDEDETVAASATPADAAPDASTDAAVDAPPDAFDAKALYQATCRPCEDPNCHATCNPPPPSADTPCGWRGKRCAPPRPADVNARIIGVQIQGADSIIVVGRGADLGVAKDWRAQLLLDSGKLVDAIPLEIIEVRATTTRIRLHGTFEGRLRMVRLSPPP
jgi:hypothetical protein